MAIGRTDLNNLLSNAFKFTEQGQVGFICANGPYITFVFRIQESVSRRETSNDFRGFSQKYGTPVVNYGGTGLGLSIVESLLDF